MSLQCYTTCTFPLIFLIDHQQPRLLDLPPNMTRGEQDLGDNVTMVDMVEYSISNVTQSNISGLNIFKSLVQLMSTSTKPKYDSNLNMTSIPSNTTNATVPMTPLVTSSNQRPETATSNVKSTTGARATTEPYMDFYEPYNRHTNYVTRGRKSNYIQARLGLNMLNVMKCCRTTKYLPYVVTFYGLVIN